MTAGATFVDVDLTVAEAASRMASEDFGALPVCSSEGRLQGVITDRDIVVKVIAAGLAPTTPTVGEVAGGTEVVTLEDEDSAE